MKIKLLIFTSIILLAASCTKTSVTYYENGQKSTEITYRNSTPVGEAYFWHPNGELMQLNSYEDGKVNGTLKRWHPNGNPEAEEEYKNDLRHGISKQFNNDGALTLEAYYKNDTLNGAYREFYPDGSIKISGGYQNGLFEGEWKWYDYDGVVLGEASFHQGSGIQKAWRRDGTLLREVEYYQNLKHGSSIHFNEKGEVEKQIKYDRDSVIEIDDAE